MSTLQPLVIPAVPCRKHPINRLRFPAARGAQSLIFWGRRDRTLRGLKRRGVGGSGIYHGFLVGYGRCSYFPIRFVAVAIGLCRPAPTAFASRFPSRTFSQQVPSNSTIHKEPPGTSRVQREDKTLAMLGKACNACRLMMSKEHWCLFPALVGNKRG